MKESISSTGTRLTTCSITIDLFVFTGVYIIISNTFYPNIGKFFHSYDDRIIVIFYNVSVVYESVSKIIVLWCSRPGKFFEMRLLFFVCIDAGEYRRRFKYRCI